MMSGCPREPLHTFFERCLEGEERTSGLARSCPRPLGPGEKPELEPFVSPSPWPWGVLLKPVFVFGSRHVTPLRSSVPAELAEFNRHVDNTHTSVCVCGVFISISIPIPVPADLSPFLCVVPALGTFCALSPVPRGVRGVRVCDTMGNL